MDSLGWLQLRPRRAGADRSRELLRQGRGRRGRPARDRAHRQPRLRAGDARAARQQYVAVPRCSRSRGWARIGDRGALPQIQESAASSRRPAASCWPRATRASCSARPTSSRLPTRWGSPTPTSRRRSIWPRSRCRTRRRCTRCCARPTRPTRMIAAEILGTCRQPAEGCRAAAAAAGPVAGGRRRANEAIAGCRPTRLAAHQ